MASAPAFAGVLDQLECTICRELFTDPITLDCGHNFCRVCITKYCEGWKELGDLNCPLCVHGIKNRNFRRNWLLANMVEGVQLAKQHLCVQHMKKFNLFCQEDSALVCEVCEGSSEHKSHSVLPLEKAAEEYKEKIQAQLHPLNRELEKLVKRKEDEEQRSRKCLRQFEVEKEEIMSVFEQMNKFLAEKERLWLTQLADLEKEFKEKYEGNITRLSKEISRYSNLITDMMVKCQQPPRELLPDIKGTLERCLEGQVREKLELSLRQEWRIRTFCLKSSTFQSAMEEFQGALKKAPSKETITLDPRTANPSLLISQDLKSVRNGNRRQYLLDYPERFNVLPWVLGQERFRSGKHWWEVEVEMPSSTFHKVKGFFTRRICGMWAVGVAPESIRRKGSFIINPNEGISPQPHEVLAFTSNEPTPLNLSCNLRKIRVFLDYRARSVEFFDADTDSLIFTFPPASFSGETICPFFRVVPGVSLKC